MIGPETRLTYFPEEVRSAIEREPIVLGLESIGSHFRNPEEIYDIEQIISEQIPPISVGLVGSRIEGKFAYTPKELFDKLRSYGQKNTPLQALGYMIYRKHGLPYETYQEHFNSLVAYLRGALLTNTSMDQIDLTTLPPKLLKYLTFEPYSGEIPFIYRPKGFENLDPSIPILQRPAAYYPDIDIALITDKPLQGVTAWTGITIGKESGVCIQVTPIFPNSRIEDYHQQNILKSMLATFRPLSPIPKAEL